MKKNYFRFAVVIATLTVLSANAFAAETAKEEKHEKINKVHHKLVKDKNDLRQDRQKIHVLKTALVKARKEKNHKRHNFKNNLDQRLHAKVISQRKDVKEDKNEIKKDKNEINNLKKDKK
jgi:hypothetical protein